MLNKPDGITISDYIYALRHNALTHARITFMNKGIELVDENIESSGITLTSVLNSDEDLTMGRAVMSEMNVTFLKDTLPSGIRWDDEAKLEIGVEYEGNTYWTTLGYFTGTKRFAYATTGTLDYTAKDRMQKFDVLATNWIASLSYPITVGEMYHSLCRFCGVPYEDGDELADMMNRSYNSFPIDDTETYCRDILAAIAEACGCYAKITADGNCKMVWYKNVTEPDAAVTSNEEFFLEYFDMANAGTRWQDLENKTWEELEDTTWAELGGYRKTFCVDALLCKQDEEGPGVAYPGQLNGNVYTIVGNPFLNISGEQQRMQYLSPLYSRLSIGYLPLSVDCIGNPLIEAGDILLIQVGGVNIRTPIFTKVMRWNGSITDTYETTGNVQRQTVSMTSFGMIDVNALNAKVNTNQKDLQETRETVAEVSNLVDLTDQLSISTNLGTISQLSAYKYGRQVDVTFLLTLSIGWAAQTVGNLALSFDDANLLPIRLSHVETSTYVIPQGGAIYHDGLIALIPTQNIGAGNAFWIFARYLCIG